MADAPKHPTDLVLTVRYFAAAGEAAGTDAETIVVPVDATVGHLRAILGAEHGAELERILGISALLVGGRSDLDDATALRDALGGESTVDVLPPFAGG